jgi:hypothetical protein
MFPSVDDAADDPELLGTPVGVYSWRPEEDWEMPAVAANRSAGIVLRDALLQQMIDPAVQSDITAYFARKVRRSSHAPMLRHAASRRITPSLCPRKPFIHACTVSTLTLTITLTFATTIATTSTLATSPLATSVLTTTDITSAPA